MEDLIEKIEQWGHDRGIIRNSTPLAQSRKTIEEVHELITACAQLQACRDRDPHEKDVFYRLGKDGELADAIGDVFVTLVMVACCAKLDVRMCVSSAYEVIKGRKGYLRPDGVFVKEVE